MNNDPFAAMTKPAAMSTVDGSYPNAREIAQYPQRKKPAIFPHPMIFLTASST
jgi:hypothetical protein